MDILIAGGGIGGMCAAITLARAGHQVKLVDIDPEWRALGAGMTLNGAALRAFGQVGVLDAVKAEGYCRGAPVLAMADGQVFAKAPPTSPFGPDIPPIGGIMRPVLHKILQAATRDAGAEVQLGVGVTGVEQTGARVTARLSDGSRAEADLLLGADGVSSTVRGLVFPDAPRPHFTGQGCWRAVVPRPSDVTGPHMYFGFQKCGFNPVSETQMYLFHLQNVPDNPRMPEDRMVELLQAQLEEFSAPHIRDIRENLSHASMINYRPLEAGIMPAPWFKGRVLLIGDAAHATTPHSAYGAGLAIEDGVVLAEELAQDRDLQASLEAFMARRFERCRAVVEGSIRQGELEQSHAPVPEQGRVMQEVGQIIAQPI